MFLYMISSVGPGFRSFLTKMCLLSYSYNVMPINIEPSPAMRITSTSTTIIMITALNSITIRFNTISSFCYYSITYGPTTYCVYCIIICTECTYDDSLFKFTY